MKVQKTNALRLLEQAQIPYEALSYVVDENDLTALHVAGQLGQDPAQVFKTLVLCGDCNGLFVCVIPGNAEVDLKKVARISGNKSVAMLPMKELLPVTGYMRGGCSPIGMKKHFPTFIHETCRMFDQIFVSAGRRGLQLKLAPHHLIELTGASLGDLVVSIHNLPSSLYAGT